MDDDITAVLGCLKTSRVPKTAKGIAQQLNWYHQSDVSAKRQGAHETRVVRALSALVRQGIVTRKVSADGTKWVLSKDSKGCCR
ncbi:hypothetical protein CMI47_20125 [Candidatus Pacearchaeota archaeon]|nr:hypothetical protein [Candidatus Pacearchaeota archaeon]